MEDLFKKFIYAGVGLVSLTNDRVQDAINGLIKESKLSETEGKKIMDELLKNSDTKRKEFEKQVTGIASRVMKGMGVAANSDLEELKRTVKGTSKSGATAAGSKSAGAAKSSKAAAPATAKAASATSKAAGATKKAADKVSATATKTQRSAAGKAGAAKREDNGGAAADNA